MLGQFEDEARQRFLDAGDASRMKDARPWVWSDPQNSFLMPFWVHVLGCNAAVVFVHRGPAAIVSSLAFRNPTRAEVLDQWDRYNRIAMVHCSEWPAFVMSYEGVVESPKATILELGGFLEECGISLVKDAESAVDLVEGISNDRETYPNNPEIGAQYRVLAEVLEQLDGRHFGAGTDPTANTETLIEATSHFYDKNYYGISYDKSGVPYRRDEKLWVDLCAALATAIVTSINPQTVLDVGCASGMLVEALRDRNVDARGIDISSWAIDQVPEALRQYCSRGSITDELEGNYDLITCSEVLEHLPASFAADAVANLCRHSSAILFSSTPSHFDEPTHLNVEPGSYWAQLFLRQGFVRDVDYDATFLAPHAVLFRRRQVDIETLVADYERGLSRIAEHLGRRVEDAVAEHDRLAQRYLALAEDLQQRDLRSSEIERLNNALDDLKRRRSAETLSAFDMVRQYEAGQRHLAALVNIRDAELDALRRTKVFRYTTSLRSFYGWIRRLRKPPVPPAVPAHPPDGTYQFWVEQFDTLDDTTRDTIRKRITRLGNQPLISVIMPVYDTPAEFLRAAIDSVRNQLYSNWELCIADDCSREAYVAEILAEYEALDIRIKVARRESNGHISAACNTALAMATGEWVACLDHDDILAEHALALVVAALAEHPEAGIVYSDEDKLDSSGVRQDPYFKPDFDPLLLIGQNYLNHLCLYRRNLVCQVGGYREGYEGSQDWDLALRVSEGMAPQQVVHIPHVLYHWRTHMDSTASSVSSKPYAIDAGTRAVVDHLARTHRSGRVTRIPRSGHNRVFWDLPDPAPLVSILIPTRDGTLLQRCIESVLAFTTYPNFELVVVDNSSRSLPILDFLRANDDRMTVIRDERPFNYSAINNAAVRQSSGDIICLLNDDTEVIAGDWLTELVGHVLQPGVGAAGAKLYYDDGRIQHAGVVLGMLGVAGHYHRLFDRLSAGYFGRLQVAQSVSAVTAACMVIRREVWDQMAGLDEQNLPIAFNDVDFALRLREAGWRVVWSPYAEMFHHESVSRGPDDTGPRAAEFAREFDFMQRRWGPAVLRNDPYYNPNLSLNAEDFSLAWPPRASYR